MAPATHLLWLDLETTGTDEHADPILEIGVILTEARAPFRELAEFTAVIGDGLPDGWHDRMPEVVLNMHTVNGLLDEIPTSTWSAPAAAQAVIATMSPFTKAHHVMLAGSGVGHFDRRFLAAQMPALDRWLQFPCLDVGVLRRAMVFTGRTDLIPETGDYDIKPHRGLDDARLHLAEWRHYAGLIDAFVDHGPDGNLITATPGGS